MLSDVIYTFLFTTKKLFLALFKMLSVFRQRWLEKYTLGAPLILFATHNFTKFQLAPISCISRDSNEPIKQLFNQFSDKV